MCILSLFFYRSKDSNVTEPKTPSYSKQLLQRKKEECDELKQKLEDVEGRLESNKKEQLQLKKAEEELQKLHNQFKAEYDRKIDELQYAQKWVNRIAACKVREVAHKMRMW